ncbi:carboxyltransferase domain-containing protein [Siminovitchia acidinfaciens]|uniref:Carboxyltransferase domain-containing protein n=1 Tax=Siminovitchia acidinfaciens TaxID=2321395 RepID=A0A429XUE8_9BACI|nr:carboxyltransferase domain-containing protein [Siminovitchia acidinfaciens]RST71516.1 carboxyltransferase domain-containing protein [Siminovitchia acidinfaciens]
MIFFSETKFDFCGDEYIFAEISREMKIESTLKALSITNELSKRNIPGIIEIYPNNASYLVRYDPNVISPHHLLDYLRDVDRMKNTEESLNVDARIIEIPVLYDDEETRKISLQYSRHHGESEESNFDYVMKLRGFKSREEVIRRHSGPLYLVTAIGFKPGTAWCFPLRGTKSEMVEVPKYRSPREYTPERAVGLGGVFTVVYPSESPGSYQLIGRSAVPVYDVYQRLAPFKESFVLARPGDLWKYRPVSKAEYQNIREEVLNGTYEYKIKPVSFSATKYDELGAEYIEQLKEEFDR